MAWSFVRLLQILPYSVVWTLAKLLGGLIWMVPSCRRLIIANLSHAIPEVDAQVVGRESVTHLCATFLEMFWVMDRPKRLEACVDLSGADLEVQQALKEDGCVLLSPHLGNWELGHQRLAQKGVAASCVALEQRNPYLESLFSTARSAYDAEVIHGRGAIRQILKAFKEPRLVEMLVDQNTSSNKGGVFVDYFGLPAMMSRAPATLVRKAGVRLAVGYLKRMGNGKFKGRFKLLKDHSADFESDESLLNRVNRETENCIRESPEQYLWLYKRWRKIPPGTTEEEMTRYPYYADRRRARKDAGA